MKKYLLDTNICIFYIKGKFGLDKKFETANSENSFISEITLAELKFGIEKSEKKEKNKQAVEKFLKGVTVLPIFHALDLYASEKARLQKAGTPVHDFDLLIGATALRYNLTLVTNNTEHFNRLSDIVLEDWTK